MDLLIFIRIKTRLEHELKRVADLKRLLDDEFDQIHSEVSDVIEIIQKELDASKNSS